MHIEALSMVAKELERSAIVSERAPSAAEMLSKLISTIYCKGWNASVLLFHSFWRYSFAERRAGWIITYIEITSALNRIEAIMTERMMAAGSGYS